MLLLVTILLVLVAVVPLLGLSLVGTILAARNDVVQATENLELSKIKWVAQREG